MRKVTSDDVQLGNFATVADATKCKKNMKNFGDFYNNQIETANTIILSRTDGMAEEKLDQCVAMIREHNKDAVIAVSYTHLDVYKRQAEYAASHDAPTCPHMELTLRMQPDCCRSIWGRAARMQ